MAKKIIAVLIVCVVAAIGIAALSGPAQEQEEHHRVYEFAALGARCAAGADNYISMANDISERLEEDNKQLQDKLAQAEATAHANASSSVVDINKVRGQYFDLYVAGGMTDEEYSDKVSHLDEVQKQYGEPDSSTLNELNRIREDAAQFYRDTQKEITEMEESAAKLQSCANSARKKYNFTTSDVAEFEALIQSSL